MCTQIYQQLFISTEIYLKFKLIFPSRISFWLILKPYFAQLVNNSNSFDLYTTNTLSFLGYFAPCDNRQTKSSNSSSEELDSSQKSQPRYCRCYATSSMHVAVWLSEIITEYWSRGFTKTGNGQKVEIANKPKFADKPKN